MSDSDKPVFKRSPAGQALHFTVTLMRPRELREWMGDSSPENGTYVALVVAPNVDEAVAIARAEVYAADKKDGAGKYIRDLPPPRPNDPPKLRFEPECYPVVFVQAGRHEVLYFGWQIKPFQPPKSAKRAHDKLAGGNETLPRNAQKNKYPAAEVDIGVISELYTAGETEDGQDYVAERYRVVARVKADGRTFMLSHYWKGCEVSEDGEGGTYFADVRERAAACAEIDAEGFRALAVFDTEMHGSPANPDAEWYETEPEYGSKHWQALDAAEGQAARFDRSIALHRAGEPQDEYTPTF